MPVQEELNETNCPHQTWELLARLPDSSMLWRCNFWCGVMQRTENDGESGVGRLAGNDYVTKLKVLPLPFVGFCNKTD